MNILSILKKKYEDDVRKTVDEPRGRKQLNVKVDYRLFAKIKRLSAEFAVPQYVITEHVLEIGCFYLNRILANSKKRDVLRNHLLNMHLLDNGYDDPEEILRIGEGRYAAELIALSKDLIMKSKSLERVFVIAKKTGKTDNFYIARRNFLKSALIFTDWLYRHPLEEPDNEDFEDSEESN